MYERILDWIGKNYGGQEMEDPCYNIEELVKYLEGSDYDNYKLCYVEDDTWGTYKLWFSKNDLTLVWGDDWNDAPYEHNAGAPYREGNHYVKIIIEVDNDFLKTPRYGYHNSPFTIEDINNRKQIPWLRTDFDNIYAGATYREVLDKLNKYPDICIYK